MHSLSPGCLAIINDHKAFILSKLCQVLTVEMSKIAGKLRRESELACGAKETGGQAYEAVMLDALSRE